MSVRDAHFPKEIQDAAVTAQRDTGCPACITLAQWALESAYGRFVIGKYNFFGIKWYDGCGFPYLVRNTHEVKDGHEVPIAAKFIDFPTLAAAFDYHGRLIMNPHSPYYGQAVNILKRSGSWKLYLQEMARHYATDPHYADKLLGLIATYKLDELNLPISQ